VQQVAHEPEASQVDDKHGVGHVLGEVRVEAAVDDGEGVDGALVALGGDLDRLELHGVAVHAQWARWPLPAAAARTGPDHDPVLGEAREEVLELRVERVG
jgi:hypothetical protein